PRMDGLTFLENLMRLRPMPVVMVSSLTERGAETTLQALELGAVDFVTKPKIDLEAGIRQYADELIAKIKSASKARVRGINNLGGAAAKPKPAAPRKMLRTTEKLIAIGSSTGGTEAIKDVLLGMPADAPAIVIAQHIPAAFSGPFAQRMDRTGNMRVCEARDGQQIVPGHVYIAPGDWHLRVVRDGARYVCRLDQSAPVNRHRPSCDVLLKSVAENAGVNAVGAILTGMGDDGARGLLAMREAGCRTLVQDEASSVVWGMPGAAHKLGAAEQVLPLSRIADALLDYCAGSPARSAA
ncbi:MAG: protein-glutamate methylesterase/protein-glutamine glutaminase, partial [Panacagrimonas sp.]